MPSAGGVPSLSIGSNPDARSMASSSAKSLSAHSLMVKKLLRFWSDNEARDSALLVVLVTAMLVTAANAYGRQISTAMDRIAVVFQLPSR